MLPSAVADVTTSTGRRVDLEGGSSDATSVIPLYQQAGNWFWLGLPPAPECPTAWPEPAPKSVEYLPVRDVASEMTGYGALVSRIVCAFFTADALSEQPFTTWRTQILCEPVYELSTYTNWDCRLSRGLAPIRSTCEVEALVVQPAVAVPELVRREIGPTAAERLREKSGLDAGRLAAALGVSRVTYQNWIAGAVPQGSRRERLLEVMALVEQAERRLGSPHAVGDWLLTPATSTGRTPIDLLRLGDYDTFRGFLLHLPTGRERVRPLATPPRTRRRMSAEEVEDALARLRPRISSRDFDLVDEAPGSQSGGDSRT